VNEITLLKIIDRKIKWLIAHLSMSTTEKHIQRVKWERELEELTLKLKRKAAAEEEIK
jgi:hypothetical protein